MQIDNDYQRKRIEISAVLINFYKILNLRLSKTILAA